MIVVDTSAIVAIDLREPSFELISALLLSRKRRLIPATAVVEATMVLSRIHKNPKTVLNRYISRMGLTITAIDPAIAETAQDAFLKFGKGRHPARLNLCDCFSYALAKLTDAPLLFVGNDFSQTDIRAA